MICSTCSRKYASRLDAQDVALAKVSEDKTCTSTSNKEMTHKTKEAERERERKMDENFTATPRSARTARTRGLAEMAKHTNECVAFKKKLDEQTHPQEGLKVKKRRKERKYAELYRRDGEQAKKQAKLINKSKWLLAIKFALQVQDCTGKK